MEAQQFRQLYGDGDVPMPLPESGAVGIDGWQAAYATSPDSATTQPIMPMDVTQPITLPPPMPESGVPFPVTPPPPVEPPPTPVPPAPEPPPASGPTPPPAGGATPSPVDTTPPPANSTPPPADTKPPADGTTPPPADGTEPEPATSTKPADPDAPATPLVTPATKTSPGGWEVDPERLRGFGDAVVRARSYLDAVRMKVERMQDAELTPQLGTSPVGQQLAKKFDDRLNADNGLREMLTEAMKRMEKFVSSAEKAAKTYEEIEQNAVDTFDHYHGAESELADKPAAG